MPALSPTMDEGTLARWLVAEGASVKAGDVIAEIETDKATMEIEAAEEGTLARILVAAGTPGVKVNTPIATIDVADGIAPTSPTVVPAPSPVPAILPSAPLEQVPEVKSAHETAVAGTSTAAISKAAAPSAPTASVTQTIREALRDAMAEEMRRDPDVLLIGEEVAQYHGAYKVSQGLLEEFGPRRVIDTPITEQGFAGIGIGAALAGLKPVVEFMTWNFAMQAIDQIVNSAAKTRYMSGGQIDVPIVFRGANGAAARVAAQHSQCYSAWYAHVPGLKVVAPSTPADAKGLLKAAIRDRNPVLMLENEMMYSASGPVPVGDDILVPIGKARIARPGSDVTIVSFLRGMTYALKAADILAADGIEAEVIDLRSLRPIDMDTILASVARTNRLVTVEEAWPVCSIGSEICARVAIDAFDDLDAPPAKVTGADVPMPYAANLEKLALPSVEDVVKAVRKVCYA
ncbi:MAG: pyruvate dehydrogenase complex E1 component subunit beta [Hyphomicrobiaceae bacterium]|nr:pyruvate dehydrogenase complex E1 component subunit beta [Hyphomicrobiaceae bacterium]